MRKIPTVFKRDPENMKHVLNEVTPGCEWVFDGVGVPTRKYDGTCVMFDGERWWARREVKPGKAAPEGFQAISTDENTGKTMGWEPIEQSPFAKFHAEALFDYVLYAGEGPAATGTYELCGPKINGNPEGYAGHVLVMHESAASIPMLGGQQTYESVREVVVRLGVEGAEGVVWHHPDGRMAKLKARDLPSRMLREEVDREAGS